LLLLLWLLWSVYLNDEVDYEEEIEHMVDAIHRLNNEIEWEKDMSRIPV
jgi:hypothetical protein